MRKTEFNISVTAKQNGFVVDVYGNRVVGLVAESKKEAVERMLEQLAEILEKDLMYAEDCPSEYKSYKITVEGNDTLKDIINKQNEVL